MQTESNISETDRPDKSHDTTSGQLDKHICTIQNDLFRDFYNQAPASAIGDALAVFVLGYILSESVYHPYLIAWFTIAQILNVSLLLSFILYKIKKPDNEHFSIWRKAIYIICISHGAAWGTLGLLAYTSVDTTVFYLSVVVIMGLAAASISVMGPIFKMYIIHKILFFAPVISLSLLTATTTVEYAIPLFMFLYFVFLITTGFYHSKNITEMLSLRESNNDMLDLLGLEIEERKNIEKQLRKAINAAESANQAKTQFLANMSHEIRTPLTAVIGFSEILKNPNLEKEKQLNTANTIAKNGIHLLNIVNDILDITKIESEKLNVEKITVSPIKIVQDIEEIFRPLIENKNIQLCVNYIFPLPAHIESDPVRLKQILFNLLANAIKFTDTGSITVTLESTEKETESNTDRNLLYKVSDTGIGLSSKQIETIFDAFDQADTTITRKYGGSGLGLTISRRLALLLGGKLTVNSTINQGSEFTFQLPQDNASSKTLFNNLSEYEISREKETTDNNLIFSGNILVAEDTIDIQELLSYYLEGMPVKLTFVDNGKKAIEHALNNQYDLILMDMQMPVMGGLEASKVLREKDYNQPIVAMTANTFSDDIDLYNKNKINGYLAKPFNKDDLYRVLSSYLKSSKLNITTINDNTNSIITETNAETKTQRNERIYEKLAAKFIDRLSGMLEAISESIQNEDREVLCRKSHTLKGLGGGFGQPKITEIASAIEKLGEENNFIEAARHFKELEAIYRDIIHKK